MHLACLGPLSIVLRICKGIMQMENLEEKNENEKIEHAKTSQMKLLRIHLNIHLHIRITKELSLRVNL